MSEIILWILKSFVVLFITFWVVDSLRRATYQSRGRLKYKMAMRVVALLNFAFATLLWWTLLTKNYHYEEISQTISLTLLTIFFTSSAIYLILEVIFTEGEFDEEKIRLKTIWSGRKNQKWQDLISIESNDALSWYVLRFKDGTKIRLSYFLGGVGDVIDFLIDEDFGVED